MLEEALELKDEVIKLRRDFHMHPELGFEEFRTSDVVEEYLENLGIEVKRMCTTGVVGSLKNGSGRVFALRADMDALPITEKNDVPYRSRHPGKMHACGHDAHIAMLLVAAKILSNKDFDGEIRFIFQPAEEGFNGALKMVTEGAIDGVEAIAGVHVWSELESGTLAISPGPVMASVDGFKVIVRGKGGHGASPHQTIDPVVIASSIVLNLQTIVSRNVSPLKSAVVTVGRIYGGTAFNIVPDAVTLEGTVRAFEPEIRDLIENRIFTISRRIAEAYGADVEIEYTRMNKATVNDEKLTDLAIKVAKRMGKWKPQDRTMGGEDFSEYASRIPGVFAFLGVRNEKKGIVYPHHSPKFDVDEDALPIGVAFEASMALEFLKQGMD